MKKLISIVVILFLSINAQVFEIGENSFDGDYRKRIIEFDNLIQTDSSNINSYIGLAKVYFNLNKFQQAADVLLLALKYDNSNAGLYSILGSAYLESEQYVYAKETLEKSLSIDCSNINVILKAGKTYYALKEWQNGKELFEKLIEIDKSTANYYEQLARFDEALKNYDDAIVHLQIANRLNNKNTNTIIRLSNLFFKTDRTISALRIADAGLIVYPQLADVWRIKSEAHIKLEEFDKAETAYRNTLLFGDTAANVYRNLGVCLFMQNEIDEAIDYLDTAFTKNNKDIVTILYLGAAYRDKGEIENAFKFLQMVEEVWMNRYVIESYIQLASLYQQEKVFAKSIEYYIKAMQKDPERISLKFRLAAVYDEYYSNKQKAFDMYSEFLKDSSRADPLMLDYARERIEAIKEKLFFSK